MVKSTTTAAIEQASYCVCMPIPTMCTQRCIKLEGETDSAIRWRKRTGMTSPRGRGEASKNFYQTFVKNSFYYLL